MEPEPGLAQEELAPAPALVEPERARAQAGLAPGRAPVEPERARAQAAEPGQAPAEPELGQAPAGLGQARAQAAEPGQAPAAEQGQAPAEPEQARAQAAEPGQAPAEPEQARAQAAEQGQAPEEPEPGQAQAEPEPEQAQAEPEPEQAHAEPAPARAPAEPEPEQAQAEPEPEQAQAEPAPARAPAERAVFRCDSHGRGQAAGQSLRTTAFAGQARLAPLKYLEEMAEHEWTVEDHLRGCDQGVIELYGRFLELVETYGPFELSVSKSAITFKGTRRGFAGAKPKKMWLDGYLDLQRQVMDSRIRRASPYTKRLFVHQFRVSALDQLDDEFAGWVREAYEVGAGGHLDRTPQHRTAP